MVGAIIILFRCQMPFHQISDAHDGLRRLLSYLPTTYQGNHRKRAGGK